MLLPAAAAVAVRALFTVDNQMSRLPVFLRDGLPPHRGPRNRCQAAGLPLTCSAAANPNALPGTPQV
jgi:hypothetical protein